MTTAEQTLAKSALENALFLVIPLEGGPFGGPASVDRVHALCGQLEKRLARSDVTGKLDGDDFGEGEATIYIYGSDPHAMAAALAPVLLAAGLPLASKLIARIGDERIELWALTEGGPPW